MPSGRTHDHITLFLLPWIIAVSYGVTQQVKLTLMISACYLFSGLMFGPDLDIYSVQYKRWGILKPLWRPYQYYIPHRSFWSHGFIIGTVIRLLYLGFWLSLLILPILFFLQRTGNLPQILTGETLTRFLSKDKAIAAFIGLELGAMSHSISDYLGSGIKRFKSSSSSRKKKKRKTKYRPK